MHFTKTLLPILWTLIAVVSAVPTPAAVQVDESLITTRAPKTYNLGDASNVEKIKEWMKDNVDNDKFVFYSDDKVGWPWAKAFVAANNGYKHFGRPIRPIVHPLNRPFPAFKCSLTPSGLLFDPKYGSKFSSAFGNVDVNSNWDAALACSQAMAEFADGDVRVFNHKGGMFRAIPSSSSPSLCFIYVAIRPPTRDAIP